MKENQDPQGELAPVWTDATDAWCTSPEPAQEDIIVVQADITEELS